MGRAVGDVEQILDLIQQRLLSFLHADVLAHDHQPMLPGALDRLRVHFRDVLAHQDLIDKLFFGATGSRVGDFEWFLGFATKLN